MRKAFEDNVPRRRPRLRRAAAAEESTPGAPGVGQPVALVSRAALPLTAAHPQREAPAESRGDAGRRDRLEKIKRKVAELAAPAPRIEMERIRRRVTEAVRIAPPAGGSRDAAERLAAAYADYLLQVAVRQRARSAPASGQGRPAAVAGGSRGAPDREAKQPEYPGRIRKAASAAGAAGA